MNAALPNIETERLVVRLAAKRDKDAVLDFYQSNLEHLAPYSPIFPPAFYTKDYWEYQIERNTQEYLTDQSARMFIFEHADAHKIIGNVSLGNIVRNAAQFCHLGYGIAQDKQGKGLACEAVAAVVRFGFDQMKLHRIQATYIPTNERSGNLLKRLGFTVEGYARDYLFINGRWQDHVLTALTNPNWVS